MISPDSSRVVYLADQERDTVIEVYSVPLVGPAEAGVKLNRDLVAEDRSNSFLLMPSRSVRTAVGWFISPINKSTARTNYRACPFRDPQAWGAS